MARVKSPTVQTIRNFFDEPGGHFCTHKPITSGFSHPERLGLFDFSLTVDSHLLIASFFLVLLAFFFVQNA